MVDFAAIGNDLFNTDDRTTHASVRQRIIATAVQYGVDPALALSLAAQESEFRPGAVSKTGVEGLFQVTNDTGRPYGQTPQTRSDPDVSMQTGIRHLRDLLDETGGDVRKALRRYGDPKQADYPDKVLQHYRTQARTVPDTPENRELMAGMQRSLGPYKAPQQAQQKSLDDIGRELFGDTPAAPAPAGPGPLAPAFGLQGDVTAPDTPSGTRVPLSETFPSADVVEDMSSGAVTRTPSDLVIPIEKPSTPQAPPSPPGTYMQELAGLTPLQGVDRDRLMRVAFGDPEQAQPGWKGVAATGINMVGGTGGAMLGARFGGPAGSVVGESLGSLAARKLNVLLGLEEPGMTGDVLSVAVPLGMRATIPAAKAVVRNLPGASRVGHEVAETTLEQLPGRLAPATASDTLFAQAAQHNPAIPATSLSQTASTIAAHERGLAPRFRQPRLMGAAQDLADLSQRYQGQIPLQELDDYRKRLGLMIGQASTENWPHLGGLRKLYASLSDDLERAAVSGAPGADTLREAIRTARQEFATDDLARLWGPGRGMQTMAGDQVQIYGKRILNQFNKLVAEDKLFAGSFAPDQLNDIRQTLQHVANMTARTPTNQGPIGSTLRRIGAGASIGAGFASGNPVTGVAVGLSLEAAPHVIALALQTAPGRAAVREAFTQSGGRLRPQDLEMIVQAIGGTMRATVNEAARGEGALWREEPQEGAP